MSPSATPAEQALKERIIAALQEVYDPEIPVDIYELGLIYEINLYPVGNVHIVMTLTSPNCPVADSLPEEVKTKVAAVEGVSAVDVTLTFDPPYTQDRMSEAAQIALGLI